MPNILSIKWNSPEGLARIINKAKWLDLNEFYYKNERKKKLQQQQFAQYGVQHECGQRAEERKKKTW